MRYVEKAPKPAPGQALTRNRRPVRRWPGTGARSGVDPEPQPAEKHPVSIDISRNQESTEKTEKSLF